MQKHRRQIIPVYVHYFGNIPWWGNIWTWTPEQYCFPLWYGHAGQKVEGYAEPQEVYVTVQPKSIFYTYTCHILLFNLLELVALPRLWASLK